MPLCLIKNINLFIITQFNYILAENNMKYETISLQEARRLMLASQKLIGKTLGTPDQIVEHLGYVQIDTISVVERAHHHTLWARSHAYFPSDLDQLMASRKVFEYWSHAASLLPMNEYRYSLPMKRAFADKSGSWFPRDTKLMSAVLQRVHDEGSLRSKDFKHEKKAGRGWWDWKPAKMALERLFFEGDLEITRREGFQKVYDLPERVIPTFVDTAMPTDSEYARFLVRRTLRHHGLATANEIAYLGNKDIKTRVKAALKEMLEEGEVTQVKVESLLEIYFTLADALVNIPRVSAKILILSPFDNMLIQRKKLKSLFDFDYQIECYISEKKRRFGYFCLPIFLGSRPVARIDCKADRQNKVLLVKSIHYEKGIDQPALRSKLELELGRFAKFNGCACVEWN